MKLLNLALLLIISLFVSCNNQNKSEKIAEELCSCLRSLVDVYEETKNLTADDNAEDIQEAMSKMEAAAAESDACADRMNDKYGDLSDQQEEVEAAMQRICPNIVNTMNEIESGE